MDEHYYKQLVKRYLEGKCSDGELEVFAHLLKEGKLDTMLEEALGAEARMDEEANHTTTITLQKKPYRWLKYTAIAVLLLASIAVASYYAFHSGPNGTEQRFVQTTSKLHKNDVLPGGNKAILTLANGEKIVLDKAGDGRIARQGNINIEKTKDGHLTYQLLSEASLRNHRDNLINQVMEYNTISTPKTGQYQIILADGTKVWLNSFSSITFPTRFTGKKRKVKITGEVYFDVVQDNQSPFIVEARGQQVEVLGTSFNINAYEDERTVHTTLVNGRIKVTAGKDSEILNPGQQAEVSDQGITIHPNIDISTIIAWKNGYFAFENTDLPTLMRQFSRWYDIKPIYKGSIGTYEFVGEIPRESNLSSVLKILELSGVHFRIEGQNLVINPDNKQKYSPSEN